MDLQHTMMATLAKGAPGSGASPITMHPLDPFHLGASKFWKKHPESPLLENLTPSTHPPVHQSTCQNMYKTQTPMPTCHFTTMVNNGQLTLLQLSMTLPMTCYYNQACSLWPSVKTMLQHPQQWLQQCWQHYQWSHCYCLTTMVNNGQLTLLQSSMKLSATSCNHACSSQPSAEK